MQNEGKSSNWEMECARLLQERVALSPDKISEDYALLRTVVLVKQNDLIRNLQKGLQDQCRELDENWYGLLYNAEQSFYRLGFEDAVKYLGLLGD